MKRLKLQAHLPGEELAQRYRQSSDPVARSQWHILWLLSQDHSVAEVAKLTSYSTNWIYTIAGRYNTGGPDAIGDRRHHNPGQAPLLSPELRIQLEHALDNPPSEGGLWNGPKVARWMSEKLGRKVHAPRGWELLKQLGFHSYVPRPRHAKADQAAQETFKKRLSPIN